jgi:type III secretion protein J
MRRLLRLFALLVLVGCARTTAVVHDAEEGDANQIVVYLASRGIEATKTEAPRPTAGAASAVARYDISVSADQTVAAMAILDKLGLPRPQPTTLLSLFAETGLVPSERQEMIRYQLGLAGQIASTIRSMDGILDVQVQLAVADPLQKQPARAAVFVKHLGALDDPNNQLSSKIRRLVAGSVPGLDYDNVTLVGDRARYVDVSLSPTSEALPEGCRDYVRVLGMVVAKESVGMMRFLVSGLILVGLVLLAVALFLGWRSLPGLRTGERKRTDETLPPPPPPQTPPEEPQPPEAGNP